MEVAAARLPRATMPKPGWPSSVMGLPFKALAAASSSSRVVGTFTLYFWKTSFRYMRATFSTWMGGPTSFPSTTMASRVLSRKSFQL